MTESLDVLAAFSAARSALRDDDFGWITRSAFVERAYWLGLFHGLSALTEGDVLSTEAFRHLRECVTSREGDDGFAESPFAEALALMREAIADPRQPELATLDAALGTMVAHLAEVERARVDASDVVHSTVDAIQPLTAADAFRVLDSAEHARLQELVDSLEGRLRTLALVELRWARRLRLER